LRPNTSATAATATATAAATATGFASSTAVVHPSTAPAVLGASDCSSSAADFLYQMYVNLLCIIFNALLIVL
jgi:hypothetical protein